MAAKGPCNNCGRVMGLVGGQCSTCRKAAKGKSGEDRIKALADIKERILSGGIRTRGLKKRAAGTPPPVVKAQARVGCEEVPGSIELTAIQDNEVIPITLRISIGIRIMEITQVEAA